MAASFQIIVLVEFNLSIEKENILSKTKTFSRYEGCRSGCSTYSIWQY